MQKSIIERVFPKPQRSVLAQYDQEPPSNYHDEEGTRSRHSASTQIRLSSNGSTSRSPCPRSESKSQTRSPDLGLSQSTSKGRLQPAPLSASVVHHDDPFLAIDRAAANLQRTIQSLLDFQSQALSGRHEDNIEGSVSQDSRAAGKPTSGYPDYALDAARSIVGITPIRQPKQKRPTLRGMRRGLVKSMHHFAVLKDEELKITHNETTHRHSALEKIEDFETKREAVTNEMQILQQRTYGNEAGGLRAEAHSVEQEIHELEGRLMELRAQHRHLVDRATQIENSAASELSSYQATLAMLDKETQAFLRRPPVNQSLSRRDLPEGNSQDMYALKPDRRTLALAKEQWASELDLLETHRTNVEQERNALLEGAEVWTETVRRIDNFEQTLRLQMKAGMSTSATAKIVEALDETMIFIHQQLEQAEQHEWKLLICAIGAELEAFRQARQILLPNEVYSPDQQYRINENNGSNHQQHHPTDEEDSDVPHVDLLGPQLNELTHADSRRNNSTSDHHELDSSNLIDHKEDDNSKHCGDSRSNSNESLRATLQDFPNSGPLNARTHSLSPSASASAIPRTERPTQNRNPSVVANTSRSTQLPASRVRRHSESEDDDPGPEFLISQ